MNVKLLITSLKSPKIRKKLFSVLAMLFIARLLSHVPIPLTDGQTLRAVVTNLVNSSSGGTGSLSFLDVLSGGALSNFSVILIGLAPYINASIIIQLLTQAIPKLYALSQDGEYGRKKISQYTRILTLPLAIIQSVGAIFLVRSQASQLSGLSNLARTANMSEWVLMVSAIVGGSLILMWLGELITEEGIGNGISLLITVGIIASLPTTIYQIANSAINGPDATVHKIYNFSLKFDNKETITALSILGALIIMIWLVTKLNEAQRIITIHYAKRVQGSREYGGVTTKLPVKLITAGVIPIIFALSFLALPNFVGQLIKSNSSKFWASAGNKMIEWFTAPTAGSFQAKDYVSYIYPATYFLLVVAFTFFYTSIAFNTKEISENLHKQGGFIEGVRTGKPTEKYLGRVVNRLTFFGALALGVMALIPIIGQIFTKQNIGLQGTTILILVAVALETIRKIESKALMITYDNYSGDDFNYISDNPMLAATGARRLRLPFRRKSKNNKS